MATITGFIKAKSSTKFGFGILVNDKWYNSKEEPSCAKGDYVSFDDGGKNYINGLHKVEAPAGAAVATPTKYAKSSGYTRGVFPVPKMGDGSRSILRQNALTNAVATVALLRHGAKSEMIPEQLVSLVFEIAREYEAYSAGDIDAEVVKTLGGFDVA